LTVLSTSLNLYISFSLSSTFIPCKIASYISRSILTFSKFSFNFSISSSFYSFSLFISFTFSSTLYFSSFTSFIYFLTTSKSSISLLILYSLYSFSSIYLSISSILSLASPKHFSLPFNSI
jgi:hypothetical protein